MPVWKNQSSGSVERTGPGSVAAGWMAGVGCQGDAAKYTPHCAAMPRKWTAASTDRPRA